MKKLIKEENNMTKIEFNEKYRKQDINIDRDFDLHIDNCFKFSDINTLKNAVNDYKKLISEMPQLVKDWLLG
ncbi:hypothetical protein [Spiroplasma endosymbiont of Danaus chrysippus]|uniref:hypothetical protein n=1 Tax=Spiroplasma endosymbiont of Danaus chrysippus TaxID=2691041 RepID=UPI00157AEA44|nr:hypothetical protein [Spiroplasma endosymbiont of Danaus chrysippus]